MSFQPGANLYPIAFGTKPENVEVPHIDIRAPGSQDINFPIGKDWIDTVGLNAYVLVGLTSFNGTVTATWTQSAAAGGALNTLSDDSSTIVNPVANNIRLAGTAGQIATTAGVGSITFSLIGPYTPATYTAHGVLIGEGTSSIVATTPGTTGQVLIGSTNNDPAFGALGVNSGLTLHGVLLGEGNSAIAATAEGSTGQVLIGSTGANPAFGALGVNSGLTAHGVLLGEGNSAIVATAEGATGTVLIGATGSNPAFGALGVNSGLTLHGVLLGQTNSAITATVAGTNGQVLLGSTGNDPAFGTLTTTTGVSFTTGAHALAINVATGGFKVNAASIGVPLVAQNSYTVTQAAQTSFSLPATAAVGSMYLVASGTGNAGGWIITQGAGQTIFSGASTTTPGATGTLAGAIHTSVLLMCVIADLEFIVLGNTTGYTFV